MAGELEETVSTPWGSFWAEEQRVFLGEEANPTIDRPGLERKLFFHKFFYVSYPIFKKYISQQKQDILEVGTGSGRYGLKLAMEFPQDHITMTDVAPEAITYARAAGAILGLSNVDARQENSISLSFSNASFDTVISDAAIQYVPQYEKALSEMVRVLKPGGRIIVSAVNWWNIPHTFHKWRLGSNYQFGWEKSFTHRELASLLEKNGIRIIGYEGCYAAYGVYRLGYKHPPFKLLARILNRISKMIDRITGGAFNRTFGFQILLAGDKVSA